MSQSSQHDFEDYLKSLLNQVYTDGVDEFLELHTQPELEQILALESHPVKVKGRFLDHHPKGDRTFQFEIDFTKPSVYIKNLTGMEDED